MGAVKYLSKQIWLWLLAALAVCAVVIKALWASNDRLRDAERRASEKVDAAKKMRENRRKANRLELDDMLDDLRRMFPPTSDKNPPP